MTWGTRTLVLALLALLHIGTTIWAAPHENHQKEHVAAPTPLSLDKQKRQSETSEILIESIADDDSHGVIPLLLGLLVLGTLILLALLLLGCLLLIRVAETRSSKYRLLQSDDPDAAHGQPTTNSKPSQTFTYVDLSNMECACQDRTTGGHTTVVQPKFAVQFQTASRVEASGADAARPRDSVFASASSARKARARTGRTRDDSRESFPEPTWRTASAERKESRETVFSTDSQGPPKKRHRKDSPGRAKKNGTGRHSQENAFWERSAVIRSYLPELELGVHARGGKTRHENLSLDEDAWEGEPTTYFHSHAAEIPLGVGASHSIPPRMGSSETPSTLSPEDRTGVVFSLPERTNEASKVLTQTREPEDIRMQVFGEDDSTQRTSLKPPATVTAITAASDVTSSPLYARISDTGYEDANDLYYGHVQPGKQKPLESNLGEQSQREDVESSGIEASKTNKVDDVSMDTAEVHAKPAATRSNLERTSDSLISVNSARLRRLFEYEAAKSRAAAARASMKSTPSLRRRSEPSKKSPVIPHKQMTARSPQSTEVQNTESIESSVPVPQMVAYFDRGQSPKQGLDKGELIRVDATDALRERSPEERRRLTSSERAVAIYPDKFVLESLFVDEREPLKFDPESPTERLPLEGVIPVYHDVPFEKDAVKSEREKVDSPAAFDLTFSEDKRQVGEAEGTAGAHQMLRQVFHKETREPHEADDEPQSQPTFSDDQERPGTTVGSEEKVSAFETSQSSEKGNTLEKETPGSVWEKSPQEWCRLQSKTPEVPQKPPSGPLLSGDEADFMAPPFSGKSIVTPEVSSASFKLKLPQPPLDRTRPEPKVSRLGQDSAFTLGCGLPYKRRHDEHGSTEPFSLDEQRESRSYLSSDLETSTDNEESEKKSLASTRMVYFSPPQVGGLPGQMTATLRSKSTLGTGTSQLVLVPSAGRELMQPASSEIAPTEDFPSETTGELQSNKIPLAESMKSTSLAPESSDSSLQRPSEDYDRLPCTVKSPGADKKPEPVDEPLITAERKGLVFPPPPDESDLRVFATPEKQPVSFELLESNKNRQATEGDRSKHIVGSLSTGSMPAEGQSIPYSALPTLRLPDSSQQTSQWSSKEAFEVPATEEQLLPECKARVSCEVPLRLRAEYAPVTKPELKLQAPEFKNQPLSTRSGPSIEDDSILGLEHPEVVRRKAPHISDQGPLEEWKKELISVRGRLLKKAKEAAIVETPVEESASAPASKLEESLPVEFKKDDALAPCGHSMDESAAVDTRRVLQARDSRQISSVDNPLTQVEKKEKELASLANHTATRLKSSPDPKFTKKLEMEMEDYRERPLVQSLEEKEVLSRPQGQVPILSSSPAERQHERPEIAKHLNDGQLSERDLEAKNRTSFERVAEKTSPPMPSDSRLQLITHVLEKKDRTQLKPETQAPLQSKLPEDEDQLEKLSTPRDAGSSLLLKPVLDKIKQAMFQTDKSDQRHTIPEEDQRHLEPPDESAKSDWGQASLEALEKRSRPLLNTINRGPILPKTPEERRWVDRREAKKDTNGKPLLQLVFDKKDQGLVKRESVGQPPEKSPKDQWHFQTTEGGLNDGRGQPHADVFERQEQQPFRPKFPNPKSSKPLENNSEFQKLVMPTDVHDDQISKPAVENGNRELFRAYGSDGRPTIAREDQSSDKSVKMGGEQSLMKPTERKNLTLLVPKYQGPIRPRSPEDRHQVGRRELEKDAKDKQFIQQYVNTKGRGLMDFNNLRKFHERSPEDQRHLQTTEERVRGGPGQPPVHILERQGQQLLKSEFQVPVSSEAPKDESQLKNLTAPKDAHSSQTSKPCSNEEEKELLIEKSSSQRQSMSLEEQRQLQARNETVKKDGEQKSAQALETREHSMLTQKEQGPVLPRSPVDRHQVGELDVNKDVYRRQLLPHGFDKREELLLKAERLGELQTRSPEGQRRLESTEGGTSGGSSQPPGEVLERQARQLLESELQGPLSSRPPGNVSQLEKYVTPKNAGGVQSSQPALDNKERELLKWNSPGKFQRVSAEDQRQLQSLGGSVKGDRAQPFLQTQEKRDSPLLIQEDEGPILPGSSEERLQLKRREADEDAYDKQLLPKAADNKNQELFKTDRGLMSLEEQRQLQARNESMKKDGEQPSVQALEKREHSMLTRKEPGPVLPRSPVDRHQVGELDVNKDVYRKQLLAHVFDKRDELLLKAERPGELQTRSPEGQRRLETTEGGTSGGRSQPPGEVLERQERQLLESELQGPLSSKPPGNVSQLEEYVKPKNAGGVQSSQLALDNRERGLLKWNSPGKLQRVSPEDQRQLQSLGGSVKGDRAQPSLQTLGKRDSPLLTKKDKGPVLPGSSEESLQLKRREADKDAYDKQLLPKVADNKNQELFKTDRREQYQLRSLEDQRRLHTTEDDVRGGRQGPIASKSPRDDSQLESLVVPRHAAGGLLVIPATDKKERELFISDSPRQLQALSYETQGRLHSLDESANRELGPSSMRILKEKYQPLLEQKDEGPIFPKPSERRRQVQKPETDKDSYKQILQSDLDSKEQGLLKLGSRGQLQASLLEDQGLLQSTKEGTWSGRVQTPVNVNERQDQQLLDPNFQGTGRYPYPEQNPQREEFDLGGGGQLKAHSPGQFQARSPDEQKSIQVSEKTVDNQGELSAQLKETEDRPLQNIAITEPSRLIPFGGEQWSEAFDNDTGNDCRSILKPYEEKGERELFRLSPPGPFQSMTPEKEIPIVRSEEAAKSYLKGPILERIFKEKGELPESSAPRPIQSRYPRVERKVEEPRRTIDAQFNLEPELETTARSKKETFLVETSPPSFQKWREYSPFSTISPQEEIPDAVSPLSTSTRKERTNGRLTRLLTEFPDDETSGTVRLTKLVTEFPDNDETSAVEEQRLVPSSHSEVERVGRAAMYFLVPDNTDPSHDIGEVSKDSRISGMNAHESSPRDRRSRWARYELSSPTYQPSTPEDMAGSSDAQTSGSPVAAQGSKDLINFQAEPTKQPSYLDSEAGKGSRPTTPDPSSASPKENPKRESPD